MDLLATIHKTKYFKIAICLMLCVCTIALTFLIDYQKCQAIAPAVVLAGITIPETVAIVGAVLVACGISFTIDSAVDKASEWFYSECAPDIKQSIADMVASAENGIATVPTDVWTAARDWTQANFNEGENIVTYNFHLAEFDNGPVPFTFNAQMDEPVYALESGQIVWDGVTYTWRLDDYIGDNKTFVLLANGEDAGAMHVTVNSQYPFYVYLDAATNSSASIEIKIRKCGYNSSSYSKSNLKVLNGTNEFVSPYYQTPTITNTVTGESVLGNPGWDIEQDGTREVGYPLDWTDLWGKTYDDVANPEHDTGTQDPTEVPGIEPSWLEGLLSGLFGGIQSVLDSIWQWLQNFWNNLLQKLSEALQPLADILANIHAKTLEIVSAVTAIQENTLNPDMNNNFKNYNLPDLFLLLLLLIIAVIRLLLRALAYIVTLYGLSPSSDMYPQEMVDGINFLKNQQIPYFNMQFHSIYEIVIGFLFGLAVIRLAKKFVLSLNDGGFLAYIRSKRNGG